MTTKLSWRAQFALLLTMFVIGIGYGFLLPILPLSIQRIAGTDDPALASHTGLLTGIYTLALFLFAPLWGSLADRHGRRPVILTGLGGFAITLALLAFINSLVLLYVGRFLNGLFASALAPAAYALVGDHSPSKEWRARRFAMLNSAAAIGFLVGPMLGSFTLETVRSALPHLSEPSMFRAPFLSTSAVALFAMLVVWTLVPAAREQVAKSTARNARKTTGVLRRLFAVSFVTAIALGVFEVGLSLRGIQVLRMSTYQIGFMFSECMAVMLIVQAVVFSPLVKSEATRWLFAPGLAVLALGIFLLPLSGGGISMSIAVSLVAASAGVLSPISTYWVSLVAQGLQGTELGREAAIANLGQAVGSATAGLLFNVTLVPNAPFTITAALALIMIAIAIGLPGRLSETVKQAGEAVR